MAEIYALSEAVKHANLYAWRCEELGISITWPLVVQVDNAQSAAFQGSTCLQSRLRGIMDLRWAWVRELKDKKRIKTKLVPSEKNKADVLTKTMPAYKFKQALKLINGNQETSMIRAYLADMLEVCS